MKVQVQVSVSPQAVALSAVMLSGQPLALGAHVSAARREPRCPTILENGSIQVVLVDSQVRAIDGDRCVVQVDPEAMYAEVVAGADVVK